jgi:glycosyltransferase involved in cell wall biosynthesis
VISTGGDRRTVDMAPSSQQTDRAWPCRTACPYKYDPRFPTNYVYFVTISSSSRLCADVRERRERQPFPRRDGPVDSHVRRRPVVATICVVTSSPPFAEGGHLVMARELVRALREEGHDTGLVITPQNRFGSRAAAYLAAWCTDVQLAHEERKVDRVISLRFPGYAVQHPNHVLWLNHRMREYYDLWDQFSSHLTWKQAIKERARRALIHRVDNYLFRRMQHRFVISATVQSRLRKFGGIQSEVLYPPPPKRDYRHESYGDYLFGVSRLSPLKRFDLVLRALAEPIAAGIRFVIAGEAPKSSG